MTEDSRYFVNGKRKEHKEYHVCASSLASPEPELITERGEISYPLRRRVSRKPGYLRKGLR
jgi:hypothetical protein